MLSLWLFALQGPKQASRYHLPSAKWEWLARDSPYTAGNRKLLNSFSCRQWWKSHSGEKWECVGDRSDAPLILLVLVEDSLSVMLSAPLGSISAGHLSLSLQICSPSSLPNSLPLEADLCGPHQQASLPFGLWFSSTIQEPQLLTWWPFLDDSLLQD